MLIFIQFHLLNIQFINYDKIAENTIKNRGFVRYINGFIVSTFVM